MPAEPVRIDETFSAVAYPPHDCEFTTEIVVGERASVFISRDAEGGISVFVCGKDRPDVPLAGILVEAADFTDLEENSSGGLDISSDIGTIASVES